MRVLIPQRLDVLGRSMDSNIVTQWLGLDAACDLVLWGPGLDGYLPGMGLDEVAEYVDADVVLLPDLHHAIPGFWSDLWAGAERCRRPIVYNLGDFGSAVAQRRAVWERVRPAGVLLCYSPQNLVRFGYDELVRRLGTELLVVPLGYDAVQFSPPAAPAADRDIDLLVAGCIDPAIYPVRSMIKEAGERLAGEFNVVDLDHPGYWESFGVQGRGQAQYADLLRRTRLAMTGTGYGALMRKYWEVAGCGAVGVGDLPFSEPGSERLADAMLCIDPAWPVDRVTDEIRRLLLDRPRCQTLSANTVPAVSGCDHRERAHEYVAAFARVADTRGPRRPRPFGVPGPVLKVAAAAEPSEVPTVRPDWVDIWSLLGDGASRTRRAAAALDSEHDLVVIAFDPDVTFDADALILAGACRRSGRVVLRPGEHRDGQPETSDWSIIAAPRAPLVEALAEHRGRAGLEAAILTLGDRLGWEVLADGSFVDPATSLMRLSVVPEPRGLERALAQAVEQGRVHAAAELAGLRAATIPGTQRIFIDQPASAGGPIQDPEFELAADGRFTRLDPAQPSDIDLIVGCAQRIDDPSPLYVGIPMRAGVSVPTAFSVLADALCAAGVDLDAGPEIVVLDRLLFDCELRFLQSRLPSPVTKTTMDIRPAVIPAPPDRLVSSATR